MRKQMTGSALKVTEDLKTYIDMFFIQTTNDWNKVPGQNTKTSKKYPFKICKQEDFGESEADK